jgi:acyl-CoA synthetase (AMP-forming)/AMP-acid ligase II
MSEAEAQTLPAFLARIAAAYSASVALTDGQTELTYAELDQRSATLASALLAAGVGKASRVGLLIGNSPFFVIAFFAASRIGALPVLLPVVSAPDELAHMIKFADLQLIIHGQSSGSLNLQNKLEAALPGYTYGDETIRLEETPFLRGIWREGDDVDRRCAVATIDHQWQTLMRAAGTCCAPGDLGFMIFTSGVSSRPKGVVHTQGALVRQAAILSATRRLTAADRVFSLMPFFWVGGLSFELMASLHAGARIICPANRDVASMLALMEQQKITRATGWQSQIVPLMSHTDFGTRDLSSVIEGFNYHPACYLSLGMSETLGPHSGEPFGALQADGMEGSFGRALGDTQHRVIDPETGADRHSGEPGELWLRSTTLMHGYYKAERHQALTPDGWFRTGDIVALDDDGHLYFYGRLTSMLKSGGANVAPAEVESALNQHPAILDSVVFGLADPQYGDVVAAACLLRLEQTTDAEAIRLDLRSRLAGYKIPKYIVLLAENPDFLTASGKPRRGTIEAYAKVQIEKAIQE